MPKDDEDSQSPNDSASTEPSQPLFPGVDPADLVIATKGNLLVAIKPTGELIYGETYNPDEAAKLFWERMAQARVGYEERALILQHMESILVRLGQQDLICEKLRQEAAEEENPVIKAQRDQMAELAMRQLEMLAHQAIELGRGLARRDLPMPEIPTQVPQSFREDPDNQYEGRKGLSKKFEN